jgi:anti-anti-sigma factor
VAHRRDAARHLRTGGACCAILPPSQTAISINGDERTGDDVDFSSQRLADVVVAVPVGQIDHPNAELLKQALAPILATGVPSGGALVLDFSGVSYISSMGLRILLLAAKQLRAANARIAVAALQPVVREIFAIAHFNHVLEIFPDVRTALEHLSGSALAAYDGVQT